MRRDRFAPSPTGLLHLGHAFSALTAWDNCIANQGTFLLRIEDIDQPRCRPEFEKAIYDDLHWLGIEWPAPVLRQSERMSAYTQALQALADLGVTYPCSCNRSDIKQALGARQEGDETASGPDGPVYPGTCKSKGATAGRPTATRLDMTKAVALLNNNPRQFRNNGTRVKTSPTALINEIGDIVLARKDIGTSYHLSVTVDDAFQAITHVTRGQDMLSATPIHVLLQSLLGLPTPDYLHHRLIRDTDGKRLAKRHDAMSIQSYRAKGASPADIRAMVGLTR